MAKTNNKPWQGALEVKRSIHYYAFVSIAPIYPVKGMIEYGRPYTVLSLIKLMSGIEVTVSRSTHWAPQSYPYLRSLKDTYNLLVF